MEATQERTHARSEEDEDILPRSDKKVSADQGTQGFQEVVSDKLMETTYTTPISFKDKLLGGNDEEEDVDEDEEAVCLFFSLTKGDKRECVNHGGKLS